MRKKTKGKNKREEGRKYDNKQEKNREMKKKKKSGSYKRTTKGIRSEGEEKALYEENKRNKR